MTHDTFLSRYIGAVFAGGWGKKVHDGTVKAGEAGIYPAMAIRVVAGVAYLAKASDKHWSGIADCKDSRDLDTVYSSGDIFSYFEKNSDQDVWSWYVAQSPAVALYPGDVLVLSATDGMWEKFAYADATDITDSGTITGAPTVNKDIAGSVTNNQLIKIHL